jgi:leader peptidase (prepilin peptidase)/N-methyltransferase
VSALEVAACTGIGAALGLLVPVLVGRLPEPAVDVEESEADVADRTRRADLPYLDLWGMRPDDDTKEPYAEMARRPAIRVGAVVAGALVSAVLGLLYGLAPVQVALLPLVPVSVALAVIDWRTRLLPTLLVLPATLAVVVLGLVAWPVYGASGELVRGLVGLVVARSIYWVMWRFLGTGFGDVRLAALLGFVLAYLGWAEWLLGLWAGTVLFAVPGLLLALVRRDRRLTKVGFPFGPFMLLGALVGLALGGPFVDTVILR